MDTVLASCWDVTIGDAPSLSDQYWACIGQFVYVELPKIHHLVSWLRYWNMS